ncbi:hypothetical protein BX666DRAFT_2029136 [Dichotomocladium elegans]|nr:hypothetical protein BX666DRAFT_2029136 [Dichotomocladium elegans]
MSRPGIRNALSHSSMNNIMNSNETSDTPPTIPPPASINIPHNTLAHPSASRDSDEETLDDEDDYLHGDSDPILRRRNEPNVAKQVLKGTARIKGPNNICRVVFLTICLAGLQFTWTVEMAYGTPYLLSLGLSKSIMSLVWIAGPLSGLLMQPIVGVLSDRCTSRFGRRRPFLVLGSVVVIWSLFVIGWTREITSLFTGSEDGDTFKTVSITIAIASIYILDFSINCVDSLPPSQQEDGTAWAGRMVGLGNVAGYFMGYADLVKAFPFLGNTQLKVLCAVAAIVLAIADGITCYAVSEKTLVKEMTQKKTWTSSFKAFGDITANIWNLPRPIRRICNVQFFAWFGWFPFLFYSTTWVAEIYDETALQNGSAGDDAVGQATRAGSFAFLVYSLVSLGASFVLPLVIAPSGGMDRYKGHTIEFKIKGRSFSFSPTKYLKISFLNLQRAWTASHVIFLLAMLATVFVNDVVSASVVIGICGVSWSMTMWAPFSLLGEYISEIEDKKQAMADEYLDSAAGDSEDRIGMHRMAMSSKLSLAAGGAGLGTEGGLYQLVEQEVDLLDAEEVDGEIELQYKESNNPSDQQPHATLSSPSSATATTTAAAATASTSNQPESSIEHQECVVAHEQQPTNGMPAAAAAATDECPLDKIPAAGVLLGIHNMYIVLPQFLVTFLSSIIFHFLESGASNGEEASPDAIGVVLRFGAIMSGVAAYLSTRIGRST